MGRELLPTETVHHVNGIKTDNRTDGPLVMDAQGRLRSGNLELWSHSHPYGQEIGPKLDHAVQLLAAYAQDKHIDLIRGLLGLLGSADERHQYASHTGMAEALGLPVKNEQKAGMERQDS
ncbi:hypothetical protein ACFVHW_03940 [Streptomyces sp. NPDC127110]|uniref:hypothetical protein n=1 Tax=Streptomyces sp. NPDC127110 TaxID=3345362 RepID=UPI00363A7C5D